MYASWTGNTEKVALRFQKVFEKNGWECDLFKISHKVDYKNLPVDYNTYDFLCVGTPVVNKKPVQEVIGVLDRGGSAIVTSAGGPEGSRADELMQRALENYRKQGASGPQHKTVYGPEDKKGIVFATYAGEHLAPPKEAEPALSYLECVMEHHGFQCVGRFCCPGRHGEITSAWFKNLPERPHERDLLKAEIFIEETLEYYG
jgi:flavodoxin